MRYTTVEKFGILNLPWDSCELLQCWLKSSAGLFCDYVCRLLRYVWIRSQQQDRLVMESLTTNLGFSAWCFSLRCYNECFAMCSCNMPMSLLFHAALLMHMYIYNARWWRGGAGLSDAKHWSRFHCLHQHQPASSRSVHLSWSHLPFKMKYSFNF